MAIKRISSTVNTLEINKPTRPLLLPGGLTFFRSIHYFDRQNCGEKLQKIAFFCHIFKYGALVGIKAHTFPYWVKFGVKV